MCVREREREGRIKFLSETDRSERKIDATWFPASLTDYIPHYMHLNQQRAVLTSFDQPATIPRFL